MDKKYLELWRLARPYYEKGRVYEISQIEWMMKEGDRIAGIEQLDKKLLLPIIILHDVGYSKIGLANPNIKDKEIKIVHMRESRKIARAILEEADYDKEYLDKIVNYIAVHDNWLLGDDQPYQECKEMALFNDLDFLFVTSSFEAYKYTAESMGKSLKDFYQFWEKDEKLTRRPFCCQETEVMHKKTMEEMKKIIY